MEQRSRAKQILALLSLVQRPLRRDEEVTLRPLATNCISSAKYRPAVYKMSPAQLSSASKLVHKREAAAIQSPKPTIQDLRHSLSNGCPTTILNFEYMIGRCYRPARVHCHNYTPNTNKAQDKGQKCSWFGLKLFYQPSEYCTLRNCR